MPAIVAVLVLPLLVPVPEVVLGLVLGVVLGVVLGLVLAVLVVLTLPIAHIWDPVVGIALPIGIVAAAMMVVMPSIVASLLVAVRMVSRTLLR